MAKKNTALDKLNAKYGLETSYGAAGYGTGKETSSTRKAITKLNEKYGVNDMTINRSNVVAPGVSSAEVTHNRPLSVQPQQNTYTNNFIQATLPQASSLGMRNYTNTMNAANQAKISANNAAAQNFIQNTYPSVQKTVLESNYFKNGGQYSSNNLDQFYDRANILANKPQWDETDKAEAQAMISASKEGFMGRNPFMDKMSANPKEYIEKWSPALVRLQNRTQNPVEAFGTNIVNAAAGAGTKAVSYAVNDPELIRQTKELELANMYAKQDHPIASTAGSVAGNVAKLMTAKTLLAPAIGGMAAPVATGITTGVTGLYDNAGNLAAGQITPEQYSKTALVKGLGGFAGGLASDLVGTGIGNVLKEKKIWTPFMQYVRGVAAANAYSLASTGTQYLGSSDEQRKNMNVGEELLTGFLFSLVSNAIDTIKVTNQAEQNLKLKLIKSTVDYENYIRGMSGMTAEEKNQRLTELIGFASKVKDEIISDYNSGAFAGQQKPVDNAIAQLDMNIEMWQQMINGNMNYDGGIGVSDVDLNDINTAVMDGYNTSVGFANNASGAENVVSQPVQEMNPLAMAATSGANALVNTEIPQQTEVESAAPQVPEVKAETVKPLAKPIDLKAQVESKAATVLETVLKNQGVDVPALMKNYGVESPAQLTNEQFGLIAQDLSKARPLPKAEAVVQSNKSITKAQKEALAGIPDSTLKLLSNHKMDLNEYPFKDNLPEGVWDKLYATGLIKSEETGFGTHNYVPKEIITDEWANRSSQPVQAEGVDNGREQILSGERIGNGNIGQGERDGSVPEGQRTVEEVHRFRGMAETVADRESAGLRVSEKPADEIFKWAREGQVIYLADEDTADVKEAKKYAQQISKEFNIDGNGKVTVWYGGAIKDKAHGVPRRAFFDAITKTFAVCGDLEHYKPSQIIKHETTEALIDNGIVKVDAVVKSVEENYGTDFINMVKTIANVLHTDVKEFICDAPAGMNDILFLSNRDDDTDYAAEVINVFAEQANIAIDNAKSAAKAVKPLKNSNADIEGKEIKTYGDKEGYEFSSELAPDAPVTFNDKLVAIHNIYEDKLRKAVELGGFAMPSIAVTKADMSHDKFGEISVVFGRDTIDPKKDANNLIYSTDAYTPTFPSVDIKINRDVDHNLYSQISNLLGDDSNYFRTLNRIDGDNLTSKLSSNENDFVKAFKDDIGLKTAYLRSIGENITVPKEVPENDWGINESGFKAINKVIDYKAERPFTSEKERALEPKLRKALYDWQVANDSVHGKMLADSLYGEELEYSDLDSIFYQWIKYNRGDMALDEKSLKETIDGYMKDDEIANGYGKWLRDISDGIIEKKGIRNDKDTFTSSGSRRNWESLHYPLTLENVVKIMKQGNQSGISWAGTSIIGASAEKYKSVEDARSKSDRLNMISNEEFVDRQDVFHQRFGELADKFAAHSDGWMDAKNIMGEAVSKYGTDKTKISAYLKKEGAGWTNFSEDIVDELVDIVNGIREMPTGYFEAKPRRGIKFDEALAVVVPDDIDSKLKSDIEKQGVDVVEYKSGDEEDRAAKIREVNGALFSTELSVSADDKEKLKELKKQGYTINAYHGSPTTGITEFDIEKAGQNAESQRDKAIWFTNDKKFAEEFSYERIDNPNTAYLKTKGKKGQLYNALLKMEKPFDLRNITDDMMQIMFKSQYGYEDYDRFAEKIKELQKYGNHQYMKIYVDYDAVKQAGYDGIIARLDTYVNKNDGLEYGVFDKDQIRLVADNQYSTEINGKELKAEDLAKAYDKVSAESKKKDEKIAALENLLNDISDKDFAPDTRSIRKVGKLMKELVPTTTMPQKEIENRLSKVYQAIRNSEDGKGIYQLERSLAEDLVQGSAMGYDEAEVKRWNELKDILKGMKLKPSEAIKAEMGGSKDFNEWRIGNFANGIRTNETDGIEIDKYYQVLNEWDSSLFPEDLNDIDKFNKVREQLAALKPKANVELMDGESLEEYTEDIVDAINESYFEAGFKDGALKGAEKALREQYKKATTEYKAELKKKYQEQNAKIAFKTAWSMQNKQTLRDITRLRKKLGKNDRKLAEAMKMLTPEEQAIAENAINNIATHAQQLTDEAKAKMEQMQGIFDELSKVDENYLPDKKTLEWLARADQTYLKSLSLNELLDIHRTISTLMHHIKSIDEKLGSDKKEKFTDLYNAAKAEIKQSAGREEKTGVKKALNVGNQFWNDELLNPTNYIERLFGWNPESKGYQILSKDIEDGERKAKQIITEMNDIVRPFKDKNKEWVANSDGRGKNAKWHRRVIRPLISYDEKHKALYGDPIEVYITPAIAVELARAVRSDDFLRHAEGGVIFPDRKLYADGNIKEAHNKGIKVKLSPDVAKKSLGYETLDDTEKELFDIMDKVFDDYSKRHINEISQLQDGIDRTISDHYSKLYVDKDLVAEDMITNESISGMPSIQQRVQSSKPVYAISVWKAFEDNIKTVSKYCGLSIPLRNAQVLFNWADDGVTLKKIISEKWGQDANTYIKEYFKDQSNKKAESPKALTKLANFALSNSIAATFAANPGLVLKQFHSFWTVGAVLGFDTMPSAKQMAETDANLIKKYSPELAYRSMGWSTPEIADLTNNLSWTQKNPVVKFTIGGGAVGGMDYFTVKGVWPWCENYVKKHFADLTPGTDAFYRKVAEYYNEAVPLTQPMYDTAHRSTLMRESNPFIRTFTMFHTVPQQQLNLMRKYYGEMQYYNAKNPKGKKAKEARGKFVRSIIGVLLATLGVVGTDVGANAIKNKLKAYRNDEGELTPESFAKKFASDFGLSVAGNVIGGKELIQTIEQIISSPNNVYELNDPQLSMFNTIISHLAKISKTWQSIQNGKAKVIEEGGSLEDYADNTFGEYMGIIKQLASDIVYYGRGLPVSNVEKYLRGIVALFDSELAEKYDGLWKSKSKYIQDNMRAAKEVYDTTKNATLKQEAVDEMYKIQKNGATKKEDSVRAIQSLEISDEDKGRLYEEKHSTKELDMWKEMGGTAYQYMQIESSTNLTDTELEAMKARGLDPNKIYDYIANNKDVSLSDVKDNGFSSKDKLYDEIGSADYNEDWHHIVEQEQKDIDESKIQNSNNVVSINGGAKSMHTLLTNYYQSSQDFTDGKKVSEWLKGQSFEEQWQFGIDYLSEYGQMIPADDCWYFVPYDDEKIKNAIEALSKAKYKEAADDYVKKGFSEDKFYSTVEKLQKPTQKELYEYINNENMSNSEKNWWWDYYGKQSNPQWKTKLNDYKVKKTSEAPLYLKKVDELLA